MNLPAFKAGAWVIPSISQSVPTTLTVGESLAQKNAAVLSLDAHAIGVCIPKGKFTDLAKTLKKQFGDHIRRECGEDETLSMCLDLLVSEDRLELVLRADELVKTFALKPVIEALNAEREGLGWYVYETIRRGASDGYPVFDATAFGHFAEMIWFDPGMTDEEFAEHLRSEHGIDKSVKDEDVFNDYTAAGHRPSMLAEAFGGHLWMLNATRWNSTKRCVEMAGKRPTILSRKQVGRLLRSLNDPMHRKVVEAAMELEVEVDRKDSSLKTHWKTVGSDILHYEGTPVGASCALVWDDPTVPWELLQHYEEYELNGGDSTDIHIGVIAEADDPQDVRALVQSFLDLVKRHKALKGVLEHFPEAKHA